MMPRRGKFIAIPILIVLCAVLFGYVTMGLWNWLMPALFGLRTISFLQALGLLLLSKILFGGIHRHGPGRGGWRRGMKERWERMTPEERERFRAGMKDHRCGWPRRTEPPTTQA